MVLVNLEASPSALVAATWRQQFYTADMAATGAEPAVGERVDHDSLLGSFFFVDGGGGMHKFMFVLISSLVVFNFLLHLGLD